MVGDGKGEKFRKLTKTPTETILIFNLGDNWRSWVRGEKTQYKY